MLFIDTGAFLAYFLSKDQYHAEAVKLWKKIQKNQERCVTSNFVLDETFTLLGRMANYPFAAECAQRIYTSTILTILRPEYEDEMNALNYFKKYADQQVSFTDCVSLALMKRSKIVRVFTFDKHFNTLGFHRI